MTIIIINNDNKSNDNNNINTRYKLSCTRGKLSSKYT